MTRLLSVFACACLSVQDPILVEVYGNVAISPGEVLEVAWYEGPGLLVDAGCDNPDVRVTFEPDPAQPPSALPEGLLATASVVVSVYATTDATCEIERPTATDVVVVSLSP